MASISASISLYDKMSAPINKIISAMDSMISACANAEDGVNGAFDANKIYEARQALDRANDEMREFAKHAQLADDGVGKLLGSIGKLAAAAGIAKIAHDAVEFASNLAEVQNVVDVTFGSGASVIDEWSAKTLNAFGLNQLSAKKFAGTMGAMLKSSGLAGDAVAEMSMKITELSGDMASFYNLSGEEAFNKIRSGISGETEPLKQLGIDMSAASLEAYRLSQGMTTAYDKMSQAEKVQLRYNYLLQAAADAEGDYERTRFSFANQQKELNESWLSLTGQLATGFLPVLAMVMYGLNTMIGVISENIDWIAPLGAALVGIVGTMVIFTHTAQIAAAATKAWTMAQAALHAVMTMNTIAWVIIAIIALIGVIVAVANHIAKTGQIATTAFGVITGGINVVLQFFVQLWNAIKDICSNIPIAFNNAWYGAQSGLFTFVSTVLNGIHSIGEALNKLPFVEFDLSGLENAANNYANKAADAAGHIKDYNPITAFQDGWAADAYAKGAAWGDAKWNQWFGEDDATADVVSDVSAIAANTGSAADSLKTTTENLKYLRDIAEQDAVNRFTTAEIRIDMTNNNSIGSNMDLDGVISYLVDGVNEAMQNAAEGVYA